jgi:threonine/homoserine/homoserine lactone efflux protein
MKIRAAPGVAGKEHFMDIEHGFLLTGLLFGLTAGISPGPLLTLVISETLKYGKREGLKIAAAPLITDVPIIVFIMYVMSFFSKNHQLIGGLTLLGACYVIYLGYENIILKSTIEEGRGAVRKNALVMGVVTNAFNPHPFIFWLGIGAPIITRALAVDVMKAAYFILGFYVFLVGSKVGVALAVDTFRGFLSSRYYPVIIRVLGVVLIVFGVLFFRQGLRLIRAGGL